MAIIVKTLTRGFRTCFFRNQSVHQFYGHLQSVLREIAPGGEMDNLFARPVNAADAASSGEIEWSTDLNGEAIKFASLSPQKQQEVAGLLGNYMEKIKQYAESRQTRTGKEKDYSDYLKAVAVSPDLNQIFLINNKPVLVHWGFLSGDGNHPGQGIYAGWDEFIAEIQRKKAIKEEPVQSKAEQPAPIVLPPEPFFASEPEPAKTVEEKPVEKKPAAAAVAKPEEKPVVKPAEPKKEPEKKEEKKPPVPPKKPKKVMACGLGDYEWVKWLAILLAIIILLLLLLRLLPPPASSSPQMPPGMSSGGGGSGGGSGGGGGGMPGGGNGGGGAPQPPAPGQPCPTCGQVHGKTSPAQQSGAGQDAPQNDSRSSAQTSDKPDNRGPVVTLDGALRKGSPAPENETKNKTVSEKSEEAGASDSGTKNNPVTETPLVSSSSQPEAAEKKD